jgi:sensor histidine kinase regulating citrate/malate metabolism
MLAAALFTSSPESIVAFDQNGLITAFNGAAERVCPAHPRPGSKQSAVSSAKQATMEQESFSTC